MSEGDIEWELYWNRPSSKVEDKMTKKFEIGDEVQYRSRHYEPNVANPNPWSTPSRISAIRTTACDASWGRKHDTVEVCCGRGWQELEPDGTCRELRHYVPVASTTVSVSVDFHGLSEVRAWLATKPACSSVHLPVRSIQMMVDQVDATERASKSISDIGEARVQKTIREWTERVDRVAKDWNDARAARNVEKARADVAEGKVAMLKLQVAEAVAKGDALSSKLYTLREQLAVLRGEVLRMGVDE